MNAAVRLAIVLLAATAGVASDRCPIPRLTTTDYVSIEHAVERTASVEAFLDCLPDEFFEQGNLTYVTRSHSPERAQVNRDRPRAILFGERAETVIAYTAESDELRIIAAADDPAPHYRFVSVRFPGDGRPAVVDESDAGCVMCHNGHPIWGNYRDWNGTFGVTSDLVWTLEDREGYAAYREFLVAHAGSPRYARGIAFVHGDSDDAHPDDSSFAPRSPFAPGTGRFLRALVPHHVRVVAAKLERSELFPRYTYLLAATFLGCDWGPVVEADFERLVTARFRGDPLWYEHSDAVRRLARDPSNRLAENTLWLSRLTMLGRLLGVEPEDWSLELTRSGDSEATGPSFDLGSGIEMRDLVFREWIAGLPAGEIAAAFSGPKWDRDTWYASYLNPLYRDRTPAGNAEHGDECRALQPFLESEVEGRRLMLPAPERAPATGRCGACHESTVTSRWLAEERELLRRRLLIDRDMPPGGLSADERARWRALLE